MGGVTIFNFDEFSRKMDKKIRDWVHEDPDDIFQIRNRAMIVAGSPVFIGFAIGLIIVAIIGIGGRL